ncbi:MAG: hypothetical protein RL885_10795 [Planctomycetota bacterium]
MMVNLVAQLLTAGAQREAEQLDENLYLELFAHGQSRSTKTQRRHQERKA